MVSNKKYAMLMAMATIFLAITYVAVSEEKKDLDCNKECMPTCLKVDDATIPVCEKVCKDFCQEQGSDVAHQGAEKSSKTKFDGGQFMQKTMDYLAIRKKTREVKGNKTP